MKHRDTFSALIFLLLILSSLTAFASMPGTMKWAFKTGKDVSSSPCLGPDGTIYVGSGDSNVYAINPDGTEKWAFDTGAYGVQSSPAVGGDGTIYVGSNSKKLFAINPDGSEKWTFSSIHEFGTSPAVAADGSIYAGAGDTFFAINPDGTEKWRVPQISFLCTNAYIGSSAAVAADGTIYVGDCNADGSLYAINPDGSVKWTFPVDGQIQSSPAIGADGTIYVGSINESAASPNNNVWAINPDGTQQWVFPTVSGVYASPTIGADGAIYAGVLTGLYALNPDGTGRWGFPTSWYVVSSVAIGSDGTLYVTGWSDRLYAIDPFGTQRWVFVPPDAYVGSISSPVIDAGGTVYVGLGDTLYAIYGNSNSLADSPWPMFRQNVMHTGTSDPIEGIVGPIERFYMSAAASPQTSGIPFGVTLTARDAADRPVSIFTGALNLNGFRGPAATYFVDDFEDGNYAGWTDGPSPYARWVTADTAAVGTCSVTLTGGVLYYRHREGISYHFDQPKAPEDITFYVRSGSTGLSDGYFVVGPQGSCPIWFYMKDNGVMYANADTTFTYHADTWYKVQFLIDWAGEVFDLVVDDAPVSSGIAFRDPVSSLSSIHLYNYHDSQAWWDAIEFDANARTPVAITPSTTTGFALGAWAGDITVLEPAEDMFLAVDDGRGHITVSNVFSVVEDADTDGDGLLDSIENASCTDALDADSDDDGIPDGVEDANHSGNQDPGETNPCAWDSDGDLMPDGWEVVNGLDPLGEDASGDMDGDGFSNIREYVAGTNPDDIDDKPGVEPEIEDFETGDLSRMPWLTHGDAPWSVTATYAYHSTFAAQAGAVTDSQRASLQISRYTEAGDLSFWYAVDCEQDSDVLNFYIDGSLTGQWSGAVVYTRATYPLTTGMHHFQWEYSKDNSAAGGADTAWIDTIVFPGSVDTDSDGMPDGWEIDNTMDPLLDDSGGDMDNDFFTNLMECLAATDPLNPSDYPSAGNGLDGDLDVDGSDLIRLANGLAGGVLTSGEVPAFAAGFGRCR